MTRTRPSLATLLQGLEPRWLAGDPGFVPSSIGYDSRAVEPGALFVALVGAAVDGHRYLDQALAQGAAALLVERCPDLLPPGITVVQVADTRAALAALALRWHRDPSHDLDLLGVTGTNGKTTVTFLVEQMLAHLGVSAGRIGTLGMAWGGRELATRNTTPESFDLQRTLRAMADDAVRAVALEVSSHALAAHRVDGCRFRWRCFTNLSRDHLDLHGDEEHYFAAKRRLFVDFGPGAAWTNLDSPWGRRLQEELPATRGFSLRPAAGAELYLRAWGQTDEGIVGQLCTPAGEAELRSPLMGSHNAENLLAACSAGLTLGLSPDRIVAGLAQATGAPGRMERIPDPRGVAVFVDYAHTPDALARVLDELRRTCHGRLTVLFGCGGDRDRGKRPLMGAVAAERADSIVLTDDNPRQEQSLSVIEGILAGIPDPGRVQVLPDRAEAIAWALGQAEAGDVVLLAGKGAEPYQERQGRRVPFLDAAEARRVIAELGDRA